VRKRRRSGRCGLGRWSPDGTRIAFWHAPANPATNNTDIYAINTDGTGLANVTSTPTLREYVPDWGPIRS